MDGDTTVVAAPPVPNAQSPLPSLAPALPASCDSSRELRRITRSMTQQSATVPGDPHANAAVPVPSSTSLLAEGPKRKHSSSSTTSSRASAGPPRKRPRASKTKVFNGRRAMIIPPELRCSHCKRDLPSERFDTSSPCIQRHMPDVCHDCLSMHLQSILNQGHIIKIACPTCSSTWDRQYLRNFYADEDMERYQKLASKHFKYRPCLRSGCEHGQIHALGARDPKIRCEKCSFEHCFSHRVEWHHGLNCAQYYNKLNGLSDTDLDSHKLKQDIGASKSDEREMNMAEATKSATVDGKTDFVKPQHAQTDAASEAEEKHEMKTMTEEKVQQTDRTGSCDPEKAAEGKPLTSSPSDKECRDCGNCLLTEEASNKLFCACTHFRVYVNVLCDDAGADTRTTLGPTCKLKYCGVCLADAKKVQDEGLHLHQKDCRYWAHAPWDEDGDVQRGVQRISEERRRWALGRHSAAFLPTQHGFVMQSHNLPSVGAHGYQTAAPGTSMSQATIDAQFTADFIASQIQGPHETVSISSGPGVPSIKFSYEVPDTNPPSPPAKSSSFGNWVATTAAKFLGPKGHTELKKSSMGANNQVKGQAIGSTGGSGYQHPQLPLPNSPLPFLQVQHTPPAQGSIAATSSHGQGVPSKGTVQKGAGEASHGTEVDFAAFPMSSANPAYVNGGHLPNIHFFHGANYWNSADTGLSQSSFFPVSQEHFQAPVVAQGSSNYHHGNLESFGSSYLGKSVQAPPGTPSSYAQGSASWLIPSNNLSCQAAPGLDVPWVSNSTGDVSTSASAFEADHTGAAPSKSPPLGN